MSLMERVSEAQRHAKMVRKTTVEPPNKGHFGSRDFVLYLEAALWWEVRITIYSKH